MSFQSPAAGSGFWPAVTNTVYWLILNECIPVIVNLHSLTYTNVADGNFAGKSFLFPATGSRLLTAVTDTVYWLILNECIPVIVNLHSLTYTNVADENFSKKSFSLMPPFPGSCQQPRTLFV